MKKMGGLFLVICFFLGCVTPYQRVNLMGGYSDLQLGENIFQISFRGNGYTRGERAADYCLLRSAEVALANGFQYFVIVESAKDSRLSTYTTPTTSTSTGSATVSGNSIYGRATTTTYGGQTYLISKPTAKNTILCFRDRPNIEGLVFTAEYVAKSIRGKYGIR